MVCVCVAPRVDIIIPDRAAPAPVHTHTGTYTLGDVYDTRTNVPRQLEQEPLETEESRACAHAERNRKQRGKDRDAEIAAEMDGGVTKRLLHTRRCTPPTLSSDPRALLSPVKSSPRPRRQDMPCAKHNITPRASHAAHAIDAHVIRGDNLRHACPPGTRPYHLGGNSPGTRSIGKVGNTACRVDQAPPSNPQTLPSQCPMLGGAERQSGKGHSHEYAVWGVWVIASQKHPGHDSGPKRQAGRTQQQAGV